MSKLSSTWAMVFAAGKGTRMMPLTTNCPKPMLEVLGKPLLGHALDTVHEAGIFHSVVNAHHCPEVIEHYLPTRTTPTQITLSKEIELLETGGGVKKALNEKLLNTTEPFVAINADILWTDGPSGSSLAQLHQAWEKLAGKADVLLLLVPKGNAWGHDSANGDYALAPTGQLVRLSSPEAPYVYAGLQITKPELYADPALGDRFSNLKIFDAAQAKGKLYGLVHDGGWFHFSTPQSLDLFHQRP